jgi:glycosyltransferase involved in cell wall biosynthesis
MNVEHSPFVSIGLPVYNGGTLLRQAITTLLAQDYSRFELIISDNASEDDTEATCREFQSQDSRIRYIRQPSNQGAIANFEFVAREARGEYFMWAAHDDFWEPTYVRKCVEMLEAHPQAVLCCTEINLVDGTGNPAPGFVNYINIETLGMTPAERVHELIRRMGWFAIYGLMRRETALKLSLGNSEYGFDVILLMELLLMGDFVKVNDRLFTYRIAKAEKSAEEYEADLKTGSPIPQAPYTGMAVSLLRTVYKSKLTSREKIQVFADFIHTLTRQNLYWRQKITSEVLGVDASTDADFSHLLTLVLSRSVPLTEFKQNPLLHASFRPDLYMPDLTPLATKIVQNAAVETPATFERKRDKAVELFSQGRYDEASRLFGAALAYQETSSLWSDWATCRMACNEHGEAERGLRRALALDPDNMQAAAKLGILLANLGKNAEAVSFLERCQTSIEPSQRPAIVYLLAGCHV